MSDAPRAAEGGSGHPRLGTTSGTGVAGNGPSSAGRAAKRVIDVDQLAASVRAGSGRASPAPSPWSNPRAVITVSWRSNCC